MFANPTESQMLQDKTQEKNSVACFSSVYWMNKITLCTVYKVSK